MVKILLGKIHRNDILSLFYLHMVARKETIMAVGATEEEMGFGALTAIQQIAGVVVANTFNIPVGVGRTSDVGAIKTKCALVNGVGGIVYIL